MDQINPQDAVATLDRWRAHPDNYVFEHLNIKRIWRLQQDVLLACPRAIKEKKPIYIASGHALGKDYICGGIALWFLHCYYHSIVIETAPSGRQVYHIMWGETKAHWNNRRFDLGGQCHKTPLIEIEPGKWYLHGFSTKDTGATKEAAGAKFQGIHSNNVCVIVSEAQGIQDEIFDQIDAITTAENNLVIFIGNPTRSTGRFARGLKDKESNIVFHFSCLENPNYLKRETVIPGLASYEWVEEKRKRWGENDVRWISRVLGQIPASGANNTFPETLINHMVSRCGFLATHSFQAGVAVDSAGEGPDDNVIMSGKGGEVMEVFTKTLMTPSEIAHKAIEMCKRINGQFIIFDCDGLGVRDYQEASNLPDEYLRGIQLIKFHGSANSELLDGGKVIYANLRAEASFVTRDRGFSGKCTLEENDKELLEDLMEEEYFENEKNGLIQIEAKEDLKSRLERSPGRGDAYKMLQWAFEQVFEDKTYAENPSYRLPKYGLTDVDIFVENENNLPRYGPGVC